MTSLPNKSCEVIAIVASSEYGDEMKKKYNRKHSFKTKVVNYIHENVWVVRRKGLTTEWYWKNVSKMFQSKKLKISKLCDVCRLNFE